MQTPQLQPQPATTTTTTTTTTGSGSGTGPVPTPAVLGYNRLRSSSQPQQQQQQQPPSQSMQDHVVMPLLRFYGAHVIPASPATIANINPASPAAPILDRTVAFLQSVRLSANRDYRINIADQQQPRTPGAVGAVDEDYSIDRCSVWITHRALRVLDNFHHLKRVGSAAIVIQRVWRGHRARVQVRAMRDGSWGRMGAARPKKRRGSQASSTRHRASIIVDEADLRRLSSNSFVPPNAHLPHVDVPRRTSRQINQMQQQHQDNPSPAESERDEKERELRMERRKSKVLTFKRHLQHISQTYQDIVEGKPDDSVVSAEGAEGEGSASREVQFMQILNSDDTFRLANNLRALHKLERPATIEEAQQYYEEHGGVPGGRTPAQMYTEYSARVVEWITLVVPEPRLNIPAGTPPASQDLVALLRSGDVLCELAVAIYPKVQCQLLQKGVEFTIHKIIFFLELCKTIGIKSSMLFSVSDLLLGGVEHDPVRKSALTVLRTVCAVERQARRRGWNGPPMQLKPEGSGASSSSSDSKRRSRSSQILDADGNPVVNPQRRTSSGTVNSANRRSKTPPSHRLSTASRSSYINNNNNNKRLSSISAAGMQDLLQIPNGGDLSATSGERGPSSSLSGSNTGGANSRLSIIGGDVAAVLLPPQEFQSLSKDEKKQRLSMMTTRTARESLYSYYFAPGSANGDGPFDRSEYDEMLELVRQREETQTQEKMWEAEEERLGKEKRERDERDARLVAAFNEGMKKRGRGIQDLLVAEETYLHNLTLVSDFLSQVIYRRKRQSKRHSNGLPPLEPVTVAADGVQLQPPRDPFAPLPNESATAAVLRVESETEDLSLLDRLLSELVALHTNLTSDLRACIESPDTLSVGDAMLRFADDAWSTYINYCVVALGPTGGARVTKAVVDDGGEFGVLVAARFIGDCHPNAPGGLSSDEWMWHIKRPLARLTQYESVLRGVVGRWKLAAIDGKGKGTVVERVVGRVVRDDRRLEMAAVKIGCVTRSLLSNLGVDEV